MAASSFNLTLFSGRPLSEPLRFGPYQLVQRIGQGGMAAVYRASRRRSGGFEKIVAVKIMFPDLANQDSFVEMFSHEAALSSQLCHPNIVQVNDFGIAEGLPFLEMEWLSGSNLAQLMRRIVQSGRRLPVGVALRVVRDLCRGLDYAHGRTDENGPAPIIHRDVSPANIMVGREGTVKLLDFGVAKVLDRHAAQSNALKGKFSYMAPELLRTKAVNPCTDVFSVGVILHEILVGQRLFVGKNDIETIKRITQFSIAPPSSLSAHVPKRLDGLVLKALAFDPDRRFGSAAELINAIEQLPFIASEAEFRRFVEAELPRAAPLPLPSRPNLRVVRTPAEGVPVALEEPSLVVTTVDAKAMAMAKAAIPDSLEPELEPSLGPLSLKPTWSRTSKVLAATAVLLSLAGLVVFIVAEKAPSVISPPAGAAVPFAAAAFPPTTPVVVVAAAAAPPAPSESSQPSAVIAAKKRSKKVKHVSEPPSDASELPPCLTCTTAALREGNLADPFGGKP